MESNIAPGRLERALRRSLMSDDSTLTLPRIKKTVQGLFQAFSKNRNLSCWASHIVLHFQGYSQNSALVDTECQTERLLEFKEMFEKRFNLPMAIEFNVQPAPANFVMLSLSWVETPKPRGVIE